MTSKLFWLLLISSGLVALCGIFLSLAPTPDGSLPLAPTPAQQISAAALLASDLLTESDLGPGSALAKLAKLFMSAEAPPLAPAPDDDQPSSSACVRADPAKTAFVVYNLNPRLYRYVGQVIRLAASLRWNGGVFRDALLVVKHEEPIPARFVREFERWNVTLYRCEPWQPHVAGYVKQSFYQKMGFNGEHFARFFPQVDVIYFLDSDWIIVKEPAAPCLTEFGANGFSRDWNTRALMRLGLEPTLAARIPTIATQMMSIPVQHVTEFFHYWERLFFLANVLTAASTSFSEAESRQYYVSDMFAAGLVFVFRGFPFSKLSYYHWESWSVAGCAIAAVNLSWHPCHPARPQLGTEWAMHYQSSWSPAGLILPPSGPGAPVHWVNEFNLRYLPELVSMGRRWGHLFVEEVKWHTQNIPDPQVPSLPTDLELRPYDYEALMALEG